MSPATMLKEKTKPELPRCSAPETLHFRRLKAFICERIQIIAQNRVTVDQMSKRSRILQVKCFWDDRKMSLPEEFFPSHDPPHSQENIASLMSSL